MDENTNKLRQLTARESAQPSLPTMYDEDQAIIDGLRKTNKVLMENLKIANGRILRLQAALNAAITAASPGE